MQSREDEALARAAVDALTGQLALAPKPGLPDPRDLAARTTRVDHCALRWSAKALTPGLAAMAAAARRTGEPSPVLRAELGAIGRCTEHSVALARRRPPRRPVGAGPAGRGGRPGPPRRGQGRRRDREAHRRPPRPPRPAQALARLVDLGEVRRGRCAGRGEGRIPARTAGVGHPRHDPRGRGDGDPGPPGRPAHGDVHPPGHRTPARRGPVGPAARPGGGPGRLGGGRHGDSRRARRP